MPKDNEEQKKPDLIADKVDRYYDRFEKFSSQSFIQLSGTLFVYTSVGCIAYMIYWMWDNSDHLISQIQVTRTSNIFTLFFPAILMFLGALCSAAIGYVILNAVGAAGNDGLPNQDRKLLEDLVSQEKKESIELYIKLKSLTGQPVFLQKLELPVFHLLQLF